MMPLTEDDLRIGALLLGGLGIIYIAWEVHHGRKLDKRLGWW